MSNKVKTNWLMLIVFVLLFGCMAWLVGLSLVRNGTSYHSEVKTQSEGLKCVSNCQGFNELVRGL